MQIFQNKSTRALIKVMVALVFTGILIAIVYYTNYNKQNDPRVVEARKLYENYNALAQNNQFGAVFELMDTIENIYSQYPHYALSFEVGVLYNNRSAAFLLLALYKDSVHYFKVDSSLLLLSKDSLLSRSEKNVRKSIRIYESWLSKYENKSPQEIEKILKKNFLTGLENMELETLEAVLERRVSEIESAQEETKRRLSVSYTNLGIIYRHQDDYRQAIASYQQAIELWDRNLTAENNLNILLGKPLKKRNLIQKLFPPDKDK